MALNLIESLLSDLDDKKSEPTIHDRFAVKKLNIDGLCAAVYTPFNDLGQINISIIAQQAEYLYKTGVRSVFVAGTTGESSSLTVNEKKQILNAWINIAPKYRFTVIFHVGSNCLKDSCELAIYGESIGVDAVAALPPSYFKPVCIESLVKCIKQIADCVPLLPMYYYHIPSMTGVALSMYDFLVAADKIIPNLVGIKNTGLYHNLSFPILQKILDYKNGERYEVMTGRDEMLLQCLSCGAVGFVGSQYNFAGKLYNRIIKQYNKGNIKEARELQLKALSLLDIQINNVGKNKNVGKYIMNLLGINVGEPRLPFLSLNEKEKVYVQNALKEWCKDTSNMYL